MPTFSLVVPAFNEEGVIDELGSQLGSLMDTLDGDAEAILVDDGSSDRTYELHARSRLAPTPLQARPAVAELRAPDRADRRRRPRERAMR